MVSAALILLLIAVGANGWFSKPKGEIHLFFLINFSRIFNLPEKYKGTKLRRFE